MSNDALPTERHLRFHRRQWTIYLMGCAAMLIGTVVAVILPGENDSEIVLVPTFGIFALMLLLSFAERARRRTEFEQEAKRILNDEWMLRGMHRSLSFAFRTVIFGQVPLMFFMAYVPPEPSIVGMGAGTVALGCVAWAAGYLYHTRATTDE